MRGKLKTIAAAAALGCAAQSTAVSTAPAPTMPATLVKAPPADAGMRSNLNTVLDSIMSTSIAGGAAPGGVLSVGRYGRIVHMKGYGRQDTGPSSAVDENTMWDMASLTKVIATTTAAMMLEEQGQLDLDRTVASYLPGFNAPDKAPITLRMLITHRGGLEAFAALYKEFKGRDQYLTQINARPLKSTPGTETVYSDWDLILTQLVIEKITGQTLDRFVNDKVFAPLGMTSTMFNPDS
ncbi:MAG TPA: serine hydrolase domain-containing protein, partial [Gemmatimonadaceae bacterium]